LHLSVRLAINRGRARNHRRFRERPAIADLEWTTNVSVAHFAETKELANQARRNLAYATGLAAGGGVTITGKNRK
jgi:hypothetical protein